MRASAGKTWRRSILGTAAAALLLAGADGHAQSTLGETPSRVQVWNNFVKNLEAAHEFLFKTHGLIEETGTGGYMRDPEFYREHSYTDPKSGKLFSRIRRETKNPGNIHSIEIIFYDQSGRVAVDYLATYLPIYRNAPVQTTISLFAYNDGLTAFRQFDASGDVIFEKCTGTHEGAAVEFGYDDTSLPPPVSKVPAAIYQACVKGLPARAGKFLRPTRLLDGYVETDEASAPVSTMEEARGEIDRLNTEIEKNPKNARLYLERGRIRFLTRELEEAVMDFDQALELDPDLNSAYFGRSMAKGRMGLLEDGIADLTRYIHANPESSLAYTKRGVRHIWNKDFKSARADLETAVRLDANNAEAHDDLGVVLAQLGEHRKAIDHFKKARAIEPGYQKVHHNLAMVYYMINDPNRALASVNDSLRLDANNKSSMLLKSVVLEKLGRTAEAKALREKAEFLPGGNWSERSELR